MTQRPILNTNLDSKTFKSYYYLKEELVEFCRDNGIPTSGVKIELTDKIAYFLDTGLVKKVTINKKNTIDVGLITEDTIIERNIVCSEKHRAFFKEKIGKTKIDKQFEYNTYIRDFFETNQGRSFDDAIKCWKYKKSLPEHNLYENIDLEVLNDNGVMDKEISYE